MARKSTRSGDTEAKTIEDLGALLDELPEKPKTIERLSKLQTVLELKPQIQAARQKGYDWPEIQELLAANGVEIGLVTLKNYMQIKRTPTDKEVAPRRKRAAAKNTAGATAQAPKRRGPKPGRRKTTSAT